jgi:peroxiredoxin
MRRQTLTISAAAAASALVLVASGVGAQEAGDLAVRYQRVVADYQRIVSATASPAARQAADRLLRDVLSSLIEDAAKVKALSTDDLHALGACHEGLGQNDKAKENYSAALKKSATARTHLALARLAAADDLQTADMHFAQAVKVQPENPDIGPFHLLLARAHGRKQSWSQTAVHLEKYMGYTKALMDREPGNAVMVARHAAAQQDVDRARRFAALSGKPAPALKATGVVQGVSADLAALKGKVVLVDFCALWTDTSRQHMNRLKDLHAKFGPQGLEIVGLSLLNQHRYDAKADKVMVEKDLKADEERAGIGAYAKKHGINYRLATIDKAVTEQYGVSLLPHTVVLDKQGNVQAILRLGGADDSKELEAVVKRLLGS